MGRVEGERGKVMAAVTLLVNEMENELEFRDKLIGQDGRLASTIYLEMPENTISISGVKTASPILYTLNNKVQVEKMKSTKSYVDLLRLHGLEVGTKQTFLREYVVGVFQTKILAVYRSKNTSVWMNPSKKKLRQKTFERVLDLKDREVKRIQAMAIRALYAAGLDYGIVTCGVGPAKKIYITQINPNPRLNTELEGLFLKAVSDYRNKLEKSDLKSSSVVLGADPEFIMVNPQGNLIIASKYFPIRGKVGCDAIWYGNNRSQKPIIELRPDPTPDPSRLAVRIYQCLLQAAKRVQGLQCKWLAGGLPYEGFPIGGHIHFSGIDVSFPMLRALDNYVSLPLIVCEDEKGRKRRPKYGFLGDYRLQEYGGFEYRTPPSWLVSPTLTRGVLALAKLVVTNFEQLKHNPLSKQEIQTAYYRGNKSILKEWIYPLWQDLKRLNDYQRYRSQIDSFFTYIQSGNTWDENRDIRRAWKLPPFQTTQTKRRQ